MVCRSGETLRQWWTIPSDVEVTTLLRALAGFTGVSNATAIVVPRLLLPDELQCFSLTDLVDTEVRGETELEGRRCHHIAAHHPGFDCPYEIWIERDSLLLLRTFRHSTRAADLTGLVTDYAPSTPATIDPALFDTESLRYDRMG